MSGIAQREQIYTRTMRGKGMSWEAIRAHFKGRYTIEQLQAAVKAQRRIYYDNNYRHTGRGLVPPPPVVPSDIWADRERRSALVPKSTTAVLMGDPLPGMSALENPHPQTAPSKRGDRLDDLIYRR